MLETLTVPSIIRAAQSATRATARVEAATCTWPLTCVRPANATAAQALAVSRSEFERADDVRRARVDTAPRTRRTVTAHACTSVRKPAARSHAPVPSTGRRSNGPSRASEAVDGRPRPRVSPAFGQWGHYTSRPHVRRRERAPGGERAVRSLRSLATEPEGATVTARSVRHVRAEVHCLDSTLPVQHVVRTPASYRQRCRATRGSASR